MMSKKSLGFICFVFFSCFIYINADLISPENHLHETRKYQLNINADKFEDEGIPPALKANCKCSNGKCVVEDGKEICKCPPGFGNLTSTTCMECNCGPDAECMWDEGFSGSKVCLCKPGSALKGSKCANCDCGPDSNCTFTNLGIWKGTKKDCICKPGYVDNNGKCEGPCTNNPCQNGGTCQDVEKGYECVCPSKYTGKNCTVEANPCTLNPCKNGGNCTVSGNNFTCACETPYKGPTCETSPCSKEPCQNGGICKVGKKGYLCSCILPYKGPSCENDVCTSNPCLNNGTCTIEGKSFKCNCKSPFFGDKCEKDLCSSNPCENGGTCKMNEASFMCVCPDKFVGKTCKHACNCENGICKVTSDDKVVCECLPEFGKNSDSCVACDCGKGANCTFESGFFFDTKYCLCPDGTKLKDKHCENPCNTNPCLNDGTCKVDGKSFKCECKSPFTGPLCKDNVCSNNPCQNNATCEIKGTSFECKCKSPYFGKFCEKNPCTDNPCKDRGNCSLLANSFKCDCKKPYFGDKCEKDPCTNITCSDRGKCVLLGNSFKCDCKNPYFGDKCEKDPCTDISCSDRGKCVLLGNSFKCDCKKPYFGDKCEKDPCTTNPCKDRGTCSVVGNSFKCNCKKPYFGDKCEKDPCTTNPCKDRGNCSILGNSFKCNCKKPYFGDNCEKDPCTANPCKDRGTCSILGNSFKCNCKKPYFGDKCENDPCTTNPCKDRGTCSVLKNSFKCKCKKPYFGDNCEKDPCTDKPCNDRGTCSLLGNSFKCNCKKPYFGSKCEKDPCSDNPCNDRGNCTLFKESYKCNCKKPFFGDNCEKEPYTTSIPDTSTKIVTTSSLFESTSHFFTETRTLNFTEEFNITSGEPSDFTQDFNTTFEPSNFTVDFNYTTFEPSNFTDDFNWTTNKPTYFTSDFNDTTYEPSNFTVDFNKTTYEPSNFTVDFNDTTNEPSNFTMVFNNTTYEPANYTYNFNLTTNEPSNFTYDINMTSYEPSNNTKDNNTSETSPFVFTVSTSIPTLTTSKPGVCDNNPCKNGGTCKEENGLAKCVCLPQYSGENCTDTSWCKEGEGKVLCQGGGCAFDFQTNLGRCTCQDKQYYNYEKKQCEVVDRCPFMTKKCNASNNEVCKNEVCECKEDFIRKDDKCVPNFCASNPCGTNEDCEEIEKDPGNVKCQCKKGYIFNGKSCMEGNVCSIPGLLKCQQLCDIDTKSCDCYSGFILQSDGKSCVPENSTELCSKNCGVGVCNKFEGNDICLCPPTHIYNNITCVDLCTAGELPAGLCPNNACVMDKKMVFKCKCGGKLTYDETGFTCRKKLMCTEGGGKEVCRKKQRAICAEDFDNIDGFTCQCKNGFEKDKDGTCIKKCDLPSYEEACSRKRAKCEMDGFDTICRCPPMLTFDSDGRCSDFVNSSYIGELAFSLQRYSHTPTALYAAPTTIAIGVDLDAIRQDLRDSMHTLYGDNYHSAKVLNCRVDNWNLKCVTEVQFRSDPKDQVKLITDPNTCLSFNNDTCFIPPKMLIDKESLKTETFKEADPCSELIRKDYCGKYTECKRKKGLSFECQCSEGLEPYSSFKPLNDPNTLIHQCQDIDECKETTACPNTTACFNMFRSYKCNCLKGLKPPAEDSDIKQTGCVDVCIPNPCKHGKCEVVGGVYGCKCNDGYTGFDCNEVIINTAGKEGLKVGLIILSVLVVPSILLSVYMIYQYRVLKKKNFKSSYLDDMSSTINLQPMRSQTD